MRDIQPPLPRTAVDGLSPALSYSRHWMVNHALWNQWWLNALLPDGIICKTTEYMIGANWRRRHCFAASWCQVVNIQMILNEDKTNRMAGTWNIALPDFCWGTWRQIWIRRKWLGPVNACPLPVLGPAQGTLNPCIGFHPFIQLIPSIKDFETLQTPNIPHSHCAVAPAPAVGQNDELFLRNCIGEGFDCYLCTNCHSLCLAVTWHMASLLSLPQVITSFWVVSLLVPSPRFRLKNMVWAWETENDVWAQPETSKKI